MTDPVGRQNQINQKAKSEAESWASQAQALNQFRNDCAHAREARDKDKSQPSQ